MAKDAQNEYTKRNYDRVLVKMRMGSLDRLKELAAAAGVSVNRYILEAVEARSGDKFTLDNTLPWLKK